jgi:SAM-dependent methyltransferase
LGAKRVTSIDIQPAQIERVTRRVEDLGLSDRIIPTLVVPGVLPFEENTFDVVFSKEAINEVEDKGFLFQEIFRVLKPGGWLLASDWMKGDGDLSPLFDAWATSFNLPLRYERVSVVKQLVAQSGFMPPALTSRCEWYRSEAQVELLRTIGPLRAELLKIQKDERLYQLAVAYWKSTLHLLDSGEFEPSHFRARKPLI